MNYSEFLNELKLTNRIVSAARIDAENPEMIKDACSLAVLQRAMQGETIVVTKDNLRCKGASAGFGFSDEFPAIPGGFGNFIAHGKGEGFPPGERIKRTPELGEQMMSVQPKNVIDGKSAVRLAPYREGGDGDIVIILVNADQLSTLIHLFNYENPSYDNVIVPMSSGCASVFRIPFGELKKESPRAVVGGVDVFSRPYFPADSLFFTVPHCSFERMVELCGESVLVSPIFKGVKKRLEQVFGDN